MMSEVKLFCFPFAGGSATVFNQWRQFLQRDIELLPMELAGRGRRIREPHYDSIAEAADDVYSKVVQDLDVVPYALFGHSMGSAIALELAYKIIAQGHKMPIHIFFSGRNAPHMPKDDEKMFHLMSEEQFRTEVVELGGTPKEFFEHPELMEIFLPLLRSDFKINETYAQDKNSIKPLDCNITVMYGKDDDMITSDMAEWEKYAGRQFKLHALNGGHFYLFDSAEKVVNLIYNTLAEELSG
jgi:surfactin synthase thioesterase subunit